MEPPPPSLQAGHAPFEYVHFEVHWMVETDENSSGQIQWVQYPWEVDRRLEDMYLDASKGVDDYVA